MDEKILVVDSKIISDTYGMNATEIIQVCEDKLLQLINGQYTLLLRSIAEKDNTYKQIISYCLVTYHDEVFMMRRTKQQTESRLHNMYSVGVGGHINVTDICDEDVVISGMLRELHEEVFIQSDVKYHFLGIINDNSTEVNSVHMGLCYSINLDNKDCSVRETEKMKGKWVKLQDIGEYIAGMEGWSKILIDSYLKSIDF